MQHISKEDLKEIQQKLEEQKNKLTKDLKGFSKENKKVPGDYVSKFEDVGDDVDDNAYEVESYENNLALERVLENSLQEVNLALKRIGDGSYGRCLKCEVKINSERLKALPQSTLCIDCEEKTA